MERPIACSYFKKKLQVPSGAAGSHPLLRKQPEDLTNQEIRELTGVLSVEVAARTGKPARVRLQRRVTAFPAFGAIAAGPGLDAFGPIGGRA
jgi:hypothetical protein